jgi:hypothetical protein
MSKTEDDAYQWGLATGEMMERERIIALLTESMCNAYGEDCSDNPECGSHRAIVALIRGEDG